MTRKLVIGVTGSFGSGKTTVVKMFKSFGAETIDADKIGHALLKSDSKLYQVPTQSCTRYRLKAVPGTELGFVKTRHGFDKLCRQVYRKLVKVFGTGILKRNKDIDHRRLAGIVFGDKRALDKLNRITHPVIIRIIKGLIKAGRQPMIVLDAPLLIEAGLAGMVDFIIVVKATRLHQLQRIQRRDSLSGREIAQRIRSQIPLNRKIRMADFVIDNNGTIRNTRKQVEQIRRLLCKK